MHRYLTIPAVFYLLLAVHTFAQVGAPVDLPAGLGAPRLAVRVTPEFPEEYTDVTIRVESFSTDLNRSGISWYEDGVRRLSGVGRNTFIFKTKGQGELTTIRIVATTPDGSVEETLRFRPAAVDLIWEAVSYTPPFYRGHSLSAWGSRVRVSAMPVMRTDAGLLDPDSLIYTWKQNGTVQGSVSGVGKRTFFFTNDSLVRGQTDVEVEVGSPNETFFALKRISIKPVVPTLVLYENHPLYGLMFHHAAHGAYRLPSDEVTLSAVPYHFTAGAAGSDRLAYDWKLNGSPIAPTGASNVLTFRQVAEGSGEASLTLAVQHLDHLLQAGRESLRLFFGGAGGQ
ncbi:MAG: hypothetical protein Q8R39_00045 [bacterium]|nr:hypothetical protein [bacterium]MDZ4284775.1 hypothetical protein [Patescibacteria group bacterium]